MTTSANFLKCHLILPGIFILLSIKVDAQLNSSTMTFRKDAKTEWEFTLSIHRSFFGPLADIRTSMKMSQQTGSSPTEDVPSHYPIVTKGTPISLKFKYNISQRSGISFATGTLDAFDILRDNNSPSVKSILSATSLNYVYNFGHNRHELTSGISAVIYQMKSDGLTSSHAKTKNFGINFGYTYHFFESKDFFLALNTQYTLMGKSSIGPYSITEQAQFYDFFGVFIGTSPARTTTFPATKVNLSTFNIGISMGFRLRNDMAAN